MGGWDKGRAWYVFYFSFSLYSRFLARHPSQALHSAQTSLLLFVGGPSRVSRFQQPAPNNVETILLNASF